MTTFQIGDMVFYQPNKQAVPFFYLVVDKTRSSYGRSELLILMSFTTGDNYPVDVRDSKHYKKVS
jgi:hypothetical protein